MTSVLAGHSLVSLLASSDDEHKHSMLLVCLLTSSDDEQF